MEIDTRSSEKDSDAWGFVVTFFVGMLIGGAVLWAVETYADQPKAAAAATGDAAAPPNNAKPAF